MRSTIKQTSGVVKIVQYKVAGVPAPVDLHLDKGDSKGPDYPLEVFEVKNSRDLISRYPSPKVFEELIAKSHGIDSEQVILTAGADDALERACRSVLTVGDELLEASPTFEMVERYALVCGADVVKIPWPKEQYPLNEVLNAKTDRTRLVAVVSPNNPTGQVITSEQLISISKHFSNSLVLLDHAYVEFADYDLTPEAITLPNVVITRSFSKAWGLAGLRLGYAIGPKEVIAWMRKSGVPFSTSGMSLAIGMNAFELGQTAVEKFTSQIILERKECAELLKELGCEVYDSQANFVFVGLINAKFVWEALSGLGIAVRYFPHIPELSSALRITLPGDQQSFERLIDGLKTVLAPEALLFDIDGVIADSSKSYRQTVIQTAAGYGVNVTEEMITKLKSEGSANDDWELTFRLVTSAGVRTTLAEVTEKFEELYQGSPEGSGLCSLEKLLGSFLLIEKLSKRRKLGIVTGRPRKDAIRFLERTELKQFFDSIITRENAPLKPKPDAVCAAMEELNCKTAWMIGDTPDDIRSARNATFLGRGLTVLPIGVFAPWDDREIVRGKLHEAGAGVILGGVEELVPFLAK